MTAVTTEVQRSDLGEQRSCLLIMPLHFYAFGATLARGLAALGYTTTLANDEYPQNMLGRIMSKAGASGLVRVLTRRTLSRRFLAGRHYDLVIVIKGRGLDSQAIDLLRAHSAKFVGYHFDAFRYERGPSRWIRGAQAVCTFDYRDASENGLPVVELFSSLPPAQGSDERRFDLSAIMRNHSNRLLYLDLVMRAVTPQRSFIHIFEASLLTGVVNFIRHPRLYLKYRAHISRKSLPYAEYAAVLAASRLTVDYAHPSQTGITIRCFEAISAGTRIVTNNAETLRSALFDEQSVLVLSPTADPAGFGERLRRAERMPVTARRRTVEDFLRDLLSAGPADAPPAARQTKHPD